MINFSRIIQDHYIKSPDKEILYLQHAGCSDLPINYRQLVEGAAAYVEVYKKYGIQPGEVIILILQHGIDLVNAYFGTVLYGAIPSIMPFLTEKLLPERYRKDLASLVRITQPSAIVTYPEFYHEVIKALEPEGSVRKVFISNEIKQGLVPDFSSFDGTKRQPEDIVLLQHSSGTTGLQKGVALSHKAVINQLRSYSQTLNIINDDVVVSWLPLYHDMGLIAGFLMPILLGIPLVLLSPFEWIRAPYKLMQSVHQYRGTLSWLPNFAYNFCAQKIRDRHLEGIDLSSWRVISNCSEPMRWESHQVFFDRFKQFGLNEKALCTCYAMAENVFAVTQGGVDQSVKVDEIDRYAYQVERIAKPSTGNQPAIKMLSAGSTIKNVKIKVVSENGESLQDRHIGEVVIKSDCMLTEYYHRPDATANAFQGGWYKTGDFGYIVGKDVYITGRKKDLIIIGGKNIYPQDLEELAMNVQGVRPGRVVAFGVFDETLGTEEAVIVAEVITTDQNMREHIAEDIRQNITRGSAVALRNVYLVCEHWLVKTSSGKIARTANREKYLAEINVR